MEKMTQRQAGLVVAVRYESDSVIRPPIQWYHVLQVPINEFFASHAAMDAEIFVPNSLIPNRTTKPPTSVGAKSTPKDLSTSHPT